MTLTLDWALRSLCTSCCPHPSRKHSLTKHLLCARLDWGGGVQQSSAWNMAMLGTGYKRQSPEGKHLRGTLPGAESQSGCVTWQAPYLPAPHKCCLLK